MATGAPPSIETVRPAGLVWIVTVTGFCVNAAVCVIGAFIVMFTGLVGPVKEPVPVPVQPLKPKPLFGVAVIWTLCPLLKNPLAGSTVPPLPAFIVK